MFRTFFLILIIAAVAAFGAVVAVHALAVGGIYVFSSMKAGNNATTHDKKGVTPPEETRQATTENAGAFYTVARGDNPASIAKKLHVSCDDLLKLNNITDARKLQIGEKLRIPVKKTTTQT